MITVIDQMNRSIDIPSKPMRIISIVPSQTELLYDLGLDNTVVGITKFCIYPNHWYCNNSFHKKLRVGGTKLLDIERIKSLNPDIIIGNKEENTLEDIGILEKEFPVWMSDIFDLNDAINMILSLGAITHCSIKAQEIVSQIHFKKNAISIQPNPKKCLYLIWNNPIMAAAKSTFIDSLLMYCGCENALKSERYPILSENEIRILNPEVIMLSSEPYPFKLSHIEYFQKILPNSKIILVDGEVFSWYGSRLLHSFDYFSKLNFT